MAGICVRLRAVLTPHQSRAAGILLAVIVGPSSAETSLTNQNAGQHPTRPTVSGVQAPTIHGIDSPHVELLARLAVGGGILTTFETREICAAIVAYIEGK